MKSIAVTFWTENLKVRKSNVFWLSIVFFVFVSFMMGLIVFIQQHPGIADKMGLIGTKASLLKFGEPSWQNYFTLLGQGLSGIGIVGFGFITTWVFGREYSDNTIKDIIALPVSRSAIITSKFIIIVFWCTIVTLTFIVFALLFGYLAGISGWTGRLFSEFLSRFLGIAGLTILLSSPIAFFASYSRGFLLPIAILIVTMILANFTGLLGLGPYFPWAIPGMLTIAPYHLKLVSYVIIVLTSIAGLIGTLAWWQYADQK